MSPTCRCGWRFIAGWPRSRTSARSRPSAPRWSIVSDRCREEVEHLLQIVAIKSLCRQANVEKIETGPKGAVVSFRDNTFANPDRLVAFIRDQGPAARVRPDMKVVFFDDWEEPKARLRGTTAILRSLVTLAQPAKAA